jgi:hypothetical protein
MKNIPVKQQDVVRLNHHASHLAYLERTQHGYFIVRHLKSLSLVTKDLEDSKLGFLVIRIELDRIA